MTEVPYLIFGLRRVPSAEGDVFVVIDALEREHHVWDTTSLGRLLATLVDDSSLPRSKVDRPQNETVGLVAKIASKIMPEYADLISNAAPLAHHAAETFKASRTRVNGSSRKGPRPARRSVKHKKDDD